MVLAALDLVKGAGWTPECGDAYATLREIIGTMAPGEVKLFLKFVVGSNTIVVGDSVKVTVDVRQEGRMPSSHTCEKHLVWPVDATRKRLFMAMNEMDATGFQME